MKQILKLSWLSAVCLGMLACQVQESKIAIGRDYDSGRKMVIDTLSQFHLNDPVFVQIFNGGTPFSADSIDLIVYIGTAESHDKVLNTRKLPVDSKATDLVIRGTQKNPLTARRLLKTDIPGFYYLEARQDSQVISAKTIELYKGKK